MAHKIKVKRVPHINQDGTVGKKYDYIVRCKRRGSLCTHEKFSTRREADAHVVAHWEFVQGRKNSIARSQELRRTLEGEGVRVRWNVSPRIQNFQFHLDHKRRSRNVHVTMTADTSDFTNKTTAAAESVRLLGNKVA